MVSVVAGGVFNALAFAGAGFLFQHLNKNGYEGEMKRHNKALEDLAKARELFSENEVRVRDRIQKLRQELSDANVDISHTNQSLELLRKIRTVTCNGTKFTEEPKLENFYKPSPEMEKYQVIVGAAIGVGVGYLIYRVI